NDGHSVDGGAWILQGRRVHDVVRPDDDGEIGTGEQRVCLVHIRYQAIVGDVRLGQQHVHVTGHPARHGVDCVADFAALPLDELGQLAHLVLCLGDSQTIPGDDDDQPRVGELDGGVFHVELLRY